MLSTKQLNTLRAVIDRIVPADDYPGGWEAGVGDYILRQFERDLKDAVEIYNIGLNALDVEAWASHGNDFTDLDTTVQDELLASLEQGKVNTVWATNPAEFFRILVNHTMEGYYGDPGNGGNRDEASWKMIGFEVTG